jgi:plasmid stabilization system protein ParE
MRLTYTAEARMELVDAARYYRSCHKELGREFKQRVEAAEDDILLHPEAWRILVAPFRRKLLRQFPYGFVYHLPEPSWIEIVAVMHLHREPSYWHGRV